MSKKKANYNGRFGMSWIIKIFYEKNLLKYRRLKNLLFAITQKRTKKTL